MTLRTHALLLGLGLVIAPPSLAGRKYVQPDVVEDALAFATTDRTKSIRLLEDALEAGEHDDIRVALMLHAGEQHRLAGHADQAHAWFAQVVEQGVAGFEVDAARLGLALLEEQDSNTIRIFEIIPEKRALATQNADRYLALSVQAARDDEPALVRKYTKRALAHAREDDEVFARVESVLERLARGEEPEPEPIEPEVQLTLLEQAELALAEGRRDDARALAEELRAEATEDELVLDYLDRRIDAVAVDPGRIGVLLPLSGRYEAAGRQISEALLGGYGNAARERVLVVEDTGEDAESAVAALEKLVLEQGVIGVVGPLRSDVSDPVLEAADALRVPVVALSRTDHATADRQWVFQSMVTTHQLADALVEFAVTEQQMTGFAVFAPDTPYGHTATEAFQAAVEEQGAQVTVVEFYDAEATDLIPFAKTLGRKDYEARWREFRDLKEAAEETGANPDRVVLPPTIDFQGLFLPDAAARVPLACAALAYEEFPIGHFQTVKEGPTIPLLGLSSWNNPTLVTAGNVYVRGSYFTDVFYPGDEPGAAFVETYRTALERTPTTLEAVAFDTGLLLGGAAVSEAQTRAAFRDALLAVQVEGTITGATGFDPESREALHDIRVLSITEEEILPWDQVPADEGPQ